MSLLTKLQHLIIWIGIFGMAIIMYSNRHIISENIKSHLINGYVIQRENMLIIDKSFDNHFYINASVNNAIVKFLVDTGASKIALTHHDAQKAGINIAKLKFNIPINTASGISYAANATIDKIKIGKYYVSNYNVLVMDSAAKTSLLGMKFLELFQYYKFEDNRLYIATTQ